MWQLQSNFFGEPCQILGTSACHLFLLRWASTNNLSYMALLPAIIACPLKPGSGVPPFSSLSFVFDQIHTHRLHQRVNVHGDSFSSTLFLLKLLLTNILLPVFASMNVTTSASISSKFLNREALRSRCISISFGTSFSKAFIASESGKSQRELSNGTIPKEDFQWKNSKGRNRLSQGWLEAADALHLKPRLERDRGSSPQMAGLEPNQWFAGVGSHLYSRARGSAHPNHQFRATCLSSGSVWMSDLPITHNQKAREWLCPHMCFTVSPLTSAM